MKKILVAVLALAAALATPASADVVGVTSLVVGGGGGGASGITIGTTTITGGTDTRCLFDKAGVLGESPACTIADDDSLVTLNTASSFRSTMSGDSATSNFLNVTGTFPTTLTATAKGALFAFTTAGSSAQAPEGLDAQLLPGYTGGSFTAALLGENTVAGTGTSLFTPNNNNGVYASALATTAGTNAGLQGTAQGGGINVGAFGKSFGAKAGATNIGVIGQAVNTGGSGAIRIGGVFALKNSAVTYTDAAVLADNAALAVPVYIAYDNGTKVWSIEDNASQWSANSKALTDAAAAVAFATVTLASGNASGGQIDYCIEVIDTAGTPDRQNRCGGLVYTAVNKGGTLTITCARPSGSTTLDNTTDTLAASSGTLTDTFTCVDGGSGVLQFKVTADSSLTVATERINYSHRQWGNAATAFTPQ